MVAIFVAGSIGCDRGEVLVSYMSPCAGETGNRRIENELKLTSDNQTANS